MKSFAFILIPLFIFISTLAISQKQANIWYFGENAGLDFTYQNPEVITNSNMIAEAGCSSISDSLGNLLFYTNGNKIWNRLHQVMPNGDSIKGTYGINQNCIIIPMPNYDSLYYLFSIDSTGFYYSLINIRLDNGFGDVPIKNSKISEAVTDKITACQHCNSTDTWVIAHLKESSTFRSCLITENGISHDPVFSTCGNSILAELGYMKVSPSGDKLVLPINSYSTLFEVFNFDNLTGIVSNPILIPKSDLSYIYGAEFSADSKVLYISTGGEHFRLIQYDLSKDIQTEFINSSVIIANGNQYALQLATDGKIYVAQVNEPYLGVINHPSILGETCIFENNAIYLNGNNCKMGLPNFNQSYFNKPAISCTNACAGKPTNFSFDYNSNIDSVKWVFGNDQSSVTEIYPYIVDCNYNEPGSYDIGMYYYHCGITDSIIQFVTIYEPPWIDLGNDTTIFTGNTVTLDAGEDMSQYLWNNGSESQYLTTSSEGIYFAEVTKNNCKSSDTIYIQVISTIVALPNAFSPNADNLNDVFKAIRAGKLNDFQFAVFNRYGERIFYSTDIEKGWDGKFKGLDCPMESYVWEISYSIPELGEPIIKKLSGVVHLLR